MLPVAGRPIMNHLIERMRVAGAGDIRVITRPEKDDVIANAKVLGATVVLGHPPTVNTSFASGLADVDPDDIVLLGFPDALWDPLDGYRQLVAAVEGGAEVALGLFNTPGLEGSDYLVFHEDGRLADIDIKPRHPRSDWIWGAAAVRARRLEGLEDQEWPSGHMLALRAGGVTLHAVRLSDRYLDIGTPSSLERLPSFLEERT
jgi:glucose-1-phosphate thymidylyltransferase